jgi:peptide/nickel transport system permease protein
MHKTIIRRFLILIPQLFVISLLMFLLAYNMPGDALTGLTENPRVSPERLAEMREQLGLNDPWPQQYARWIGGIVLRGDFGHSVTHLRPVIGLIGERAANTFWLALFATALTYMIAIPLGIIAGRYNDKLGDKVIGVYTYMAMAMPTVIFALINILIFGFRLEWFPVRGTVTLEAFEAGGLTYIISRLHHMIVPAMTMALLNGIMILQYLRGEIVNHKSSDYVMTARSKGVPERVLYSRHIFRNALIPVASNIGFVVVTLLAGSVFIEQIFSFPGMGRLFLDSVTGRDYTTVNALIMIFAILYAVGSLLSDIILTIVDPRIRIK